jgi:SAM-dependent methyltransferase
LSTKTPSPDQPARPPSRNADYRWAEFDSEAYFQHYYGDPHPDDDCVIRLAVAAVKSAPPPGGEIDVVDVGTGPNLFPLFCTLPRARRLTAWEYAESNVAWLEAELRRSDTRPQWRHFWQVAREAYAPDFELPDDPIPLLREKCTITRGSVFDLPERSWDAATMFFCAESITESRDEFEAACRSYARCVKPGGLLAAAFLVRSAGYVVAERPFPVLHLSAEAIEQTFARHADILNAEQVGIVEREIRSGYSGFVFITGRAR